MRLGERNGRGKGKDGIEGMDGMDGIGGDRYMYLCIKIGVLGFTSGM